MTNPLLARFSGAAVAAFVAPEMQTQFDSCLQQAHVEMQSAEFKLAELADTGDFWAFDPDSYMARLRPYVVRDGILQIPVKGVLLHNFPYAIGSWATGYDYIWQAFQRGVGDLNVKGIALLCDTPGGEVAGNFELVDKMFALKGEKPIRGYAAESAYSAGYSIISVADEITVSRTGGVGSVGVVTGHVDVSAAMDKAGLKFTYIFAGAHKVDGNPYEPLPADVKARIQKRIDSLYAVFVSTVARNRGMEEQAVRDTEALTFTAQDALSIGFADKIGALDDSLAEYAADLSPIEGDEEMTTQASGTVDQAAHETALANARTEAHAAGRTEGLEAGATAERDRINAILASDEAKDRPAAALSCALKTSLSLDSAKAFLAGLPKEAAQAAPAAAAPATPMEGMDKEGGAGVGAGTGAETSAGPDKATAEYAMAAAKAFAIPGLKFADATK